MGLRKTTDRGSHGGEAVLAGGGKVFEKTEFDERIGVIGENPGGGDSIMIRTEECNEALDQGAFRITAKIAPAISIFADQPDLRNASLDTMRINAFVRRKRCVAATAIHHGTEALLLVFDKQEIFDQGRLVCVVHRFRQESDAPL